MTYRRESSNIYSGGDLRDVVQGQDETKLRQGSRKSTKEDLRKQKIPQKKEDEEMTTFEYFKARYDKNHDYMVECINKDIEVDSYHFVEVAYKFCFGGTIEVDPWFNIKGVDDTKEMFEQKMLKKWDDRECGRIVRHIALTKKGLKEFYKVMF